MFKITPLSDKSRQKDICEAFSAEYRPDAFCYIMLDTDDGHLMGMAQFEIFGEHGYIYDLSEACGQNDGEAMFILGRQTMNFINSCGAELIKIDPLAAEPSLIRAIGFKEENGEFSCNTAGMFDGHCSGHCG